MVLVHVCSDVTDSLAGGYSYVHVCNGHVWIMWCLLWHLSIYKSTYGCRSCRMDSEFGKCNWLGSSILRKIYPYFFEKIPSICFHSLVAVCGTLVCHTTDESAFLFHVLAAFQKSCLWILSLACLSVRHVISSVYVVNILSSTLGGMPPQTRLYLLVVPLCSKLPILEHKRRSLCKSIHRNCVILLAVVLKTFVIIVEILVCLFGFEVAEGGGRFQSVLVVLVCGFVWPVATPCQCAMHKIIFVYYFCQTAFSKLRRTVQHHQTSPSLEQQDLPSPYAL